MERRGSHDSQLGNRPLESVNEERARRSEHRQSVKGVVPEVAIDRKSLERFEETLNLTRRGLLPQRLLHRLDEVAESGRVLLVLRMTPMGRLVDRDAGRLMGQEEVSRTIVNE